MKRVKLESIPKAIQQMAQKVDRIENILSKKSQFDDCDTSNKKYNLAEAATYCGMAESTFRTYIYKRQVAGTKFGKAWLFLQTDLDKFISDHRRPTAKELKSEAFNQLNGKEVQS